MQAKFKGGGGGGGKYTVCVATQFLVFISNNAFMHASMCVLYIYIYIHIYFIILIDFRNLRTN